MKRFFASVLLLLGLASAVPAQDIGRDSLRTIYRAIQTFAFQSPTPWMDNYAWLQEKELPFFARDTFTMTWHFDPGTMLLIQESDPGLSWRAVFDPVWANGGTEPLPERYQFQQMGCLELRGDGSFVSDINFEFVLDTNLQVVDVKPQLAVFREGYVHLLEGDALPSIDFRECVSVQYRGGEAGMPTLVGAHHRKMKKIRARTVAEKKTIARLIDNAVREAYSGFRIMKVELCDLSDRACWYEENGGSAETLKTYGKITAATGPKLVRFEAWVRFEEGEDPVVKDVRVFK